MTYPQLIESMILFMYLFTNYINLKLEFRIYYLYSFLYFFIKINLLSRF